MGAALKKDQDYRSLSYIRWAAWGVIDIEALERMQRRNYINHVREELKLHGLSLECGGSTTAPYYRIYEMVVTGVGEKPKVEWSTTSANYKSGAFTKVCKDALLRLDPEGFARELAEHV
jgi:hypothetical protein